MTTVPRLGEVYADRFRLDQQLAELPGYTSYKAVELDGDEQIELWIVREELLPSSELCEQMVARAHALADLEHSHVRRVLDAGSAQSAVYVVVEAAKPAGLRRQIASGHPAPDNEIVLYATSIAEALEAGHAHGYVHGRLIPDDIVSVDGLIKVGGLGVFKDIDLRMARRLWRPVERYLAPEVRETGVLSRAADVYTMAVIMVELASGASELPIHEASQVVVGENSALADVLTPALSPSMRHRPVSARELLRGIRQVLIDDKVPTSRRTAQVPPAELFGQNDTFISRARGDAADAGEGGESPKHPFATTAAGMGDGPPPAKKKRTPTLVGISVEEVAGASEPRHTEPMGAQEFPEDEEGSTHDDVDETPVVELPQPKLRRKRRTSHSPLADPGPGADPDAADEVVELLQAKGSLPPRFVRSSAPPPVAADEVDTGEVILLRPSVESDSDQPTFRGSELPRLGSDFDGEQATGEFGRSDTDRDSPGFDDVDEEQETKVHRKAASLSSVLPLKPRDTEDAFPAASAPSRPPANLVSVRGPATAGVSVGASSLGADPAKDRDENMGDGAAGSGVPSTRESGGTTASRGRGPWLEILLGTLLAVGLAFGTWFALSTFEKRRGGVTASPADASSAPSPAPEPMVVATPLKPECPTGMLGVAGAADGSRSFCIDKHESPGAGQLPELGVTYDAAKESCQGRGVRLCTSAEWVEACRGPEQSTYPYGVAFEADRCNVHKSRPRDIVATGSFRRCESASGAFDMSGNAGEWTVGRYVHGGSAQQPGLGRCPERRWVGPEQAVDDIGYRCCADP